MTPTRISITAPRLIITATWHNIMLQRIHSFVLKVDCIRIDYVLVETLYEIPTAASTTSMINALSSLA